jgi:hypothetical protein
MLLKCMCVVSAFRDEAALATLRAALVLLRLGSDGKRFTDGARERERKGERRDSAVCSVFLRRDDRHAACT